METERWIRMYGMLLWVDVNCTRWFSHLSWHPVERPAGHGRDRDLPSFAGRGMHDRWANYDAYACAHRIRGHALSVIVRESPSRKSRCEPRISGFLAGSASGLPTMRLRA